MIPLSFLICCPSVYHLTEVDEEATDAASSVVRAKHGLHSPCHACCAVQSPFPLQKRVWEP